MCLYEEGVGGKSPWKSIREIRNIRGDLQKQIKPMKEKLEKVYEKGDELFIIGFSRGASSARVLVTELEKDGLRTAGGELVEKPPVKFLGCFDTVSMQVHENAIDIIRNAKNKEITSSEVLDEVDGVPCSIVERAVHNLALDDARCFNIPVPFPPVFMDSTDERVNEVWFSGVHGDVGGNFYRRGISDCSGDYMREFMEDSGLTFLDANDLKPEAIKIPKHPELVVTPEDVGLVPNVDDTTHIEENKKNTSMRPVVTVSKDKIMEGGTVRVHKSVMEHLLAQRDMEHPYEYNENLKETDLVVVGALNKVLEDETKQFKELLGTTTGRVDVNYIDHDVDDEEAEVKVNALLAQE